MEELTAKDYFCGICDYFDREVRACNVCSSLEILDVFRDKFCDKASVNGFPITNDGDVFYFNKKRKYSREDAVEILEEMKGASFRWL